MIRTKKEIDSDVKWKKKSLEIAIDELVRAEKRGNEQISSIRDRLSELSSEPCFEDTLDGKSKVLEQEASEKVDIILKDLSEKTGRFYSLRVVRDSLGSLNIPNLQSTDKCVSKARSQVEESMRRL